MRASLPKSLSNRRHSRRQRRRHAGVKPAQPAPSAVRRLREAGGPLDQASYSCDCGYVFVARVSTTVTCPHCQAGQAW